ncbi:MAG: hypothetical protein BGO69_10640 [Bacteroidetes bacterium 46-16]|nr:MAG: hypothetical protein BGO69_10640 [Bacteroidetes bacterium 46-16]
MSSIFCANEPTLGYLYQIRYGLKLLLQEQDENATLLIETIDDISITSSMGTDVYQTKFHLNNPPNITNASTDFWKTIRVWSEMVSTGQINPDTSVFTLVTTAAASTGSILAKLSFNVGNERDVSGIIVDMIEVADTSSNQTNQAAYTAFKALTEEQQTKLVKRIIVLDSSQNINEAKDAILTILRVTCKNYESLFERVEGWFINQVILQLQNQRQGISFRELQQIIWDVIDSLKSDNLPADFLSSIVGDETQLSAYRNMPFVKQLQIIGAQPQTINHAISDYHRAFSQASKWLREGLISPNDQMEYHAKLHDDWSRKYSALCGIVDGEEENLSAERGHNFYKNFYVAQYPPIHIKERFKEVYMVIGSCQMLSDSKKIGWHPKYETLI